MTIYEIKRRVVNAPYFFSRGALKVFGQTLKDFRVWKLDNGIYKLFAPFGRGFKGTTVRYFNSTNNRFYRTFDKAVESKIEED